ncbi:unnamed protein product [Cyprideis torosa]|uniref:tRNA synthetases class I catalytic domain-containing protein n=1 Tax=Cyprideis torosa TaxID=163714 RepID=A0A7R8W8K4_9CRUS|nr:unnamed protein product [Cyprideis torosa]CAG0884404.1 unnamed protein product [Cyprideis torosa]
MIRRVLREYCKITPIVLMGITDVDDKIIRRANESGIAIGTLTRSTELSFFNDLASLNVLPPTALARVTENIPQIVEFIQAIHDKGLAYHDSSGGSLCFDVGAYEASEGKHYFKFSSPYEQRDTALSKGKKDPRDFALWKLGKPGEPTWESPFGNGRPGWHIECSAMASRYFGSHIDIHSGGRDLAFPHHENEEAQSCAFHDCTQWATHYIHTGHLYMGDEEKMSKSLGNTKSVPELLQECSARFFRIFCLLTHYRRDLKVSPSNVEHARSFDQIFVSLMASIRKYLSGSLPLPRPLDEPEVEQWMMKAKSEFQRALTSDFNSPLALHSMLTLANRLAPILHPSYDAPLSASNTQVKGFSSSLTLLGNLQEFFEEKLGSIGLDFRSNSRTVPANEDLPVALVDSVVAFRDRVRRCSLEIPKEVSSSVKKQLLTACDEFRSELDAHSVMIKDHGKSGSSWSFRSSTRRVSGESR